MKNSLISDAEMLERIEAFCKAQNLGAATFGRLAIGDPSLVGNLRRDRSLTLRTANKIAAFMATYRGGQSAAA